MAKKGITTQHIFLGALAVLGVYVVNEQLKKAAFEKLKADTIAGKAGATGVRQVLETIGVSSPTTGSDTVNVSVPLPTCAAMFPYEAGSQSGSASQFFTDLSRSSNRAEGNCT